MQRRVVITGMGVINTLATNVPDFREQLKLRQNSKTLVSLADYLAQHRQDILGNTDKAWQHVAKSWPVASVQSPCWQELISTAFGTWRKWSKRLGRSAVLGTIASAEALQDAALLNATGESLDAQQCDPFRASVLLANSGLSFEPHERNQKIRQQTGISHFEPFYVLNGISNSLAGLVGQIYQIQGPAFNVAATGATALASLQAGKLLIEQDMADLALVGASDAPLSTSLLLCSMQSSKLVLRGEQQHLFGEGAGVLCLEEYRHALRRNAPIYGEILGTALHQQVQLPELWEPLGTPQHWAIAQNLRQCVAALKTRVTAPWQYRSHGYAAKENVDRCPETIALKEIAMDLQHGGHELRRENLKPLLGDCIGAASIMEIIAALQDPKPSTILCYSFGLGGQHASVALKNSANI